MSRHRFYTICPVCMEGDKFYWVHSDDNGDDYIWDNCDLECEYCRNRSFILNHKFKCGYNNHNEYESVDIYDLISAISQVGNIPTLSASTRRNMLRILNEKAK